jgi:biopolymer transport protein ExbD
MKKKKRRLTEFYQELDLTPAISVALILVLIFITGATQIFQSWLTVNVPRVRRAPSAQKEHKTEFKVNIHLKKNGIILLNESPVDLKSLDSLLPLLLLRSPTGLVLVSADSAVSHGDVVEIIDIAKKNGAREVALLKRRK